MVGIIEQQILPLNLSHHGLLLIDLVGKLGLLGREEQFGMLFCHHIFHGVGKGEVQGAGIHKHLLRLQGQLLAEVVLQIIAHRAIQLQPHRSQTAALFQQLLHGGAEVDFQFIGILHIDVGVAGDSEDGFFQHLVLVKHLFRKKAD